MPKPIEGSIYHEDDELYDAFSVVSTTECTGLAPAAVIDDSQRASYSELYDVPVTKNRPRGR